MSESSSFVRYTVLGVLGLVLGVVVVAGAAGAGLSNVFGAGGSGTTPVAPTSQVAGIPPTYLLLYEHAAPTCPGLSWTVLAAIGTIESGNGTSTLPGVHSGANYAGAEGPMQFEPATFAEYDQPPPPGGANPPSPYDPTDAIYAAARMLCANGARDGANLAGAIWAYNHADWYIQNVLTLAASYGRAAKAGASPANQAADAGATHGAL